MSILFGDIVDDEQGFFSSTLDLVFTSPFEIGGAVADAVEATPIAGTIRTVGVLVLVVLAIVIAVALARGVNDLRAAFS